MGMKKTGYRKRLMEVSLELYLEAFGAAYRRPDGVYVVPITALRP